MIRLTKTRSIQNEGNRRTCKIYLSGETYTHVITIQTWEYADIIHSLIWVESRRGFEVKGYEIVDTVRQAALQAQLLEQSGYALYH